MNAWMLLTFPTQFMLLVSATTLAVGCATARPGLNQAAPAKPPKAASADSKAEEEWRHVRQGDWMAVWRQYTKVRVHDLRDWKWSLKPKTAAGIFVGAPKQARAMDGRRAHTRYIRGSYYGCLPEDRGRVRATTFGSKEIAAGKIAVFWLRRGVVDSLAVRGKAKVWWGSALEKEGHTCLFIDPNGASLVSMRLTAKGKATVVRLPVVPAATKYVSFCDQEFPLDATEVRCPPRTTSVPKHDHWIPAWGFDKFDVLAAGERDVRVWTRGNYERHPTWVPILGTH